MRKWLRGRASPCQGEGREFESRLPLHFGVWRSLVACLTGGQEASGSSPDTPTIKAKTVANQRFLLFSCIHAVRLSFREKKGIKHVMKRQKITLQNHQTIAETFENYILSCKARGLADKTIKTYNQHFQAIKNQASLDIPIVNVDDAYVNNLISNLRDAGLA